MKCSELANELGINALTVGRWRAVGFPGEKGDLTPEQERYVRDKYELSLGNPVEQVKEPGDPEIVVVMPGRGASFIPCKVPGQPGTKLLKVPYMTEDNFPPGKRVLACRVTYMDLDCYVEASLAKKLWRLGKLA